MRLGNKTFIYIGLVSILLLVLVYFKNIRDSYTFLAILIILSAITSIALIHKFIIQKIIKLNRDATKLIDNNEFSRPIKTNGSDEIDSITQTINKLLSITQAALTGEKENGLSKTTQIPTKSNMAKVSHYDSITSLPNRIFFNEILNKAMNHAKRHNKILAILLIDIDSFKTAQNANDQNVGNKILNEIGQRFAKALRTEDIIAKLDGDQYIVLLNDIAKPKFASTVAEKILNACSQVIKIDGHEITLTASIGICIFPHDGDSLESLLIDADNALYKAKNMGGNAYQFYTHAMDAEAREYIKLESALRTAITNNELVLYYQPKHHIKRGKICGIEGLIRWPHKELGLIPPTSFIPLAEESGLIMQLGEWALREACKTNKRWQDEGYEHLTVAVNLSPKEFYHPDLVDMITRIIKESGLNPKYVELEITERTVMDNTNQATKILHDLKSIGVQLSVDHFGTGYTSISHLKQFPISTVKIDQIFIKGLPNNPDDIAITNAFIALVHHLGLEVVAEGVETAEQVEYLSAQNCDVIQGYYLSHPLPAQKIVLQFRKLIDEVII